MKRFGVIGMGVVGSATAYGLASFDHLAFVYDANEKVRKSLKPEKSVTIVQDLDSIICGPSEYLFVCLPTNDKAQEEKLSKFMVFLAQRYRDLEQELPIFILRSTVPPGFCANLAHDMKTDRLVHNPEFLRAGHEAMDFQSPTRIVLGGPSEFCHAIRSRVYRYCSHKFVITNYVTSECIKLMANAYLAMRVNAFNQLAYECEQFGGDVRQFEEALGYDERIGRVERSVGFGGTCLPKDLNMLGRYTLGDFPAKAIKEMNRVRDRAIGEIHYKTRNKQTIAFLGLAFKPDCEIIRGSVACGILEGLSKLRVADGLSVPRVFDPRVKLPNNPAWTVHASWDSAINQAEAVILAVRHYEFRDFTKRQIRAASLPGALVIDLCSCLSK